MPCKGTVDAIFMLQGRIQRKEENGNMCCVDMEKAFDRVLRKAIQWVLRTKGVEIVPVLWWRVLIVWLKFRELTGVP